MEERACDGKYSFLSSEYRFYIPVGFWNLTLPRGLHGPTGQERRAHSCGQHSLGAVALTKGIEDFWFCPSRNSSKHIFALHLQYVYLAPMHNDK
jgi:hypothetical protein